MVDQITIVLSFVLFFYRLKVQNNLTYCNIQYSFPYSLSESLDFLPSQEGVPSVRGA